MAEKKDPCRFTVMFNRAGPNHLRVVEVLNQQRHRKAQFIVNAVLHYLSCPETPASPESAPMDKQTILEIVAQYLESRERGGKAARPAQPTSVQHMPVQKRTPTPEVLSALDEAETLLGADELEAIADTMNAFFNK